MGGWGTKGASARVATGIKTRGRGKGGNKGEVCTGQGGTPWTPLGTRTHTQHTLPAGQHGGATRGPRPGRWRVRHPRSHARQPHAVGGGGKDTGDGGGQKVPHYPQHSPLQQPPTDSQGGGLGGTRQAAPPRTPRQGQHSHPPHDTEWSDTGKTAHPTSPHITHTKCTHHSTKRWRGGGEWEG